GCACIAQGVGLGGSEEATVYRDTATVTARPDEVQRMSGRVHIHCSGTGDCAIKTCWTDEGDGKRGAVHRKRPCTAKCASGRIESVEIQDSAVNVQACVGGQ